jgi:hypothetical protein
VACLDPGFAGWLAEGAPSADAEDQAGGLARSGDAPP